MDDRPVPRLHNHQHIYGQRHLNRFEFVSDLHVLLWMIATTEKRREMERKRKKWPPLL